MVLPLLGGSPAVWNTCLVFFQTALLLGYLYAHLQSTVLDVRVQIIIHLALLGCTFFFLPIMIPPGWTPPGSANPVPWLLLLLVMTLGLPFVLLSATSPLMQSWFSKTGKPRAADPYFLFSASNAGSLLGLLAYPVVIEPYFTLKQQSWAWSCRLCDSLCGNIGRIYSFVGQKLRKGTRADCLFSNAYPVVGPSIATAGCSSLEPIAERHQLLDPKSSGGSSVVGHSTFYLPGLLHTGFQPETDNFSQVHGLPATGNPGLRDCRGLVVEPGVMVAVSVKSLGPFCYLYGVPWRTG